MDKDLEGILLDEEWGKEEERLDGDDGLSSMNSASDSGPDVISDKEMKRREEEWEEIRVRELEENLQQQKQKSEREERAQSLGDDLVRACAEGKLERVEAILESAATENLEIAEVKLTMLPGRNPSTNWGNFTAMMAAARAGHTKVLKHLLERTRSDLEAFDADFQRTSLMWAAVENQVEAIELLRDCNHYARDSTGKTALILASETGHEEATKLLEWRSDVNAQDSLGATALINAAKEGHTKIVSALCEFNANVEVADKMKRTALFHAARFGYTEVIDKLLEYFAELDVRDRFGFSPIMIAVRWNKVSAVKALVAADASLSIHERFKGRTALHLASIQKESENLLLTLFRSPNITEDVISATDIYGKSALDISTNQEFLRSLIQNFSKGNESSSR